MPDTHSREAVYLAAGGLLLVPFSQLHLTTAYVSWLNDLQTVRFSEQRHKLHSLATCAAYVASHVKNGNLIWAIEDEQSVHVGNITATIDSINRVADIGILIGDPSARGKGSGFLAWRAVLEHLMALKRLDKVTGGCLSTNLAMIKIMEKCNMIADGQRIGHHVWEGTRVDVLYRAIFCK